MKTCALSGSLHEVFETLDKTIELLGDIFHKNFNSYQYNYEPPPDMAAPTNIFGADFNLPNFTTPTNPSLLPPVNHRAPPPFINPLVQAAEAQRVYEDDEEEEEEIIPELPLPAPTSYY